MVLAAIDSQEARKMKLLYASTLLPRPNCGKRRTCWFLAVLQWL
jgi:hypothetical protein